MHDFFKSKFANYISTDFENQFYAEKNYDITEIEEKDNSFDLIICFDLNSGPNTPSNARGNLSFVRLNVQPVVIQ